MLDPLQLPPHRHFPQPFDTGILKASVGFEAEFAGGVFGQATGDGAGDERGALLLEQRDQPSLLLHQRIDPPRLPVEEIGDGGLFVKRR